MLPPHTDHFVLELRLAMPTNALIAALLAVHGVAGEQLAATLHSRVAGEQLAVHSTPGNPISMKVSIVNTVASTLTLVPSASTLYNGTFKSPLPDAIPLYGGSTPNYGWDVVPDANGAINATMLYRDASSNGTNAYAVITMFAKSPQLPGMFGVQVNSNVHACTISLFAALYGDGPTTEETVSIHVDPPAPGA